MKLLIEIPEEKFNNFICGDSLDDKDYDEIVDFMAQGTIIPDNTVNGTAVETVFPDIEITEVDTYTGTVSVELDWWNASYKGENNAE